MAQYNFTRVLSINGTPRVWIDPVAKYGYWEKEDGSEGGGLWFDGSPDSLALLDYDGPSMLPHTIVKLLHSEKYISADIWLIT